MFGIQWMRFLDDMEQEEYQRIKSAQLLQSIKYEELSLQQLCDLIFNAETEIRNRRYIKEVNNR